MTVAARPVVLAAGGTGGHVFPAEALAERLLARGRALALVTDRRGAAYGGSLGRIDTHRIHAGTLGGGVAGAARGIVALGCGLIQARRLMRHLAPAAAVGFGGYPSVPTMVAARGAGVPTLIHEQNAVLGRTNALLARRVDRIATALPVVAGLRVEDSAKVVLTGNPVRDAVVAVRARAYAPPAADGPIRLLVVGGSQGASVMGAVVPHAVARLPAPLRARLRIAQQARAEDVDAARETYAAAAVDAEVATFFDDVPDRLAAAHLVIGRAGASTVAEIAVAGRPAILVPLPRATDDHQTANARALGDGAWVIDQPRFNAESVAGRLEAILGDPDALVRTAAAAHAAGMPDAADRLADAVEALLATNSNGAGVREAAA